MPLSPQPSSPDYAAFLALQTPLQQPLVARHPLAGEVLWLKRAGPRHGMARYRVLGLVAALTRLPVLRPVPNRGGRAAIATELARIRALAAHGIRVPEVLAHSEDAFLMRDLGAPGRPAQSLGDAIDAAPDAARALALWQQGLDTLDAVHGAGQCLSQAFARNMVVCPEGAIACIDFEDDPAAALPLALCQLRDALCYVHSTALALQQLGAGGAAQQAWSRWAMAAQRDSDFRAALASTTQRLAWLRHLPADRRWGRDAQRVRAAHDLLAA